MSTKVGFSTERVKIFFTFTFTYNDCVVCQLLKTLVNKQNELEKKTDLLLGAKLNEGRRVSWW